MPSAIKRLFSKCLVKPEGLISSEEGFRVVGAFNPGAAECDGVVHLLVRIAEMPNEKREGYVGLPYVKDGRILLDWRRDEDVTVIDERLVRLKSSGLLRLTNISHLRLAKSRDGITIDDIGETPALYPETDYEEFGIEDPRITFIDGKWYVTYVAVSRHGAVTALASTDDFVRFDRHGIIFSPDNKDVVIFPEKVDGKYIAFHRPLSAAPFSVPEVWIARSKNLLHWGEHQCMGGIGTGGEYKVGAGTPPIRTDRGWLEIYHGSYKISVADTVGTYWGRAALFELNKPERLVAQSRAPVLIPETEYDCHGFLENIVFPTGIVKKEDSLLIYYGAADTYTAVAMLSYNDVISAMNYNPEAKV